MVNTESISITLSFLPVSISYGGIVATLIVNASTWTGVGMKVSFSKRCYLLDCICNKWFRCNSYLKMEYIYQYQQNKQYNARNLENIIFHQCMLEMA